jgi:orotidine-5'-phosphate decarboxylase
MSPTARNPVFVALDTTDTADAAARAAVLAPAVGGVKLGLEFFCANGPEGIRTVMARAPGLPLFLDLKLHDIPNTVAGAVRAVAPLAPALLTVHAAGGPAMMRAAAEAAAELGAARPRIVAVTVLTSLDAGDLGAIGVAGTVAEQAARLADLALASGLDGVVCSAHEAAALRARLGPEAILVVPGIRPKGAAVGDQKRVMGPAEAVAAGASALVIGRPITEAPDPLAAARAIAAELAAA